MKLTKYTDFSLRVLIYLANLPDGARAQIPQICKLFDISPNHLSKVVNDLAKLGYVDALRGRNGGICLAKPAHQINLASVVKDMESSLDLVDCSTPLCALSGSCELYGVLGESLKAFMAVLKKYTLEDVSKNKQNILKII